MSQSVTVVITSCRRWDLLERTLDSFLACNTYPIEEYILVEDGGKKDIVSKVKTKYPFINVLFNETPIGQLKSIDLAYSQVKTPYIFHLEDDWHFHTKGNFIKDSLEILENFSTILQVWVRDREDNPHHADYIVPEWEGWNGFSFNPGLRRLRDYKKLDPYSNWKDERAIDQHYKLLGYKSAILPQTYCYHIGYDRSHYNKRKCIVNQPRGIGDILFIEPLCRWLNEGYDITFPVEDEYIWIKDYIQYINFVKKSEFKIDYEKSNWGRIGEYEYFPLRFANPLFRGLSPHDYSDQINVMKDKYRIFGQDPENWRYLKWKRNSEKEDELFNSLGLEGKKYVLVNEYSSQGKITIEIEKFGMYVYQHIYENFTLLDWAKVIENASEIHTTSTSNLYLIETLNIKADRLHLYKRVNEDLRGVHDIITKDRWILH